MAKLKIIGGEGRFWLVPELEADGLKGSDSLDDYVDRAFERLATQYGPFASQHEAAVAAEQLTRSAISEEMPDGPLTVPPR